MIATLQALQLACGCRFAPHALCQSISVGNIAVKRASVPIAFIIAVRLSAGLGIFPNKARR